MKLSSFIVLYGIAGTISGGAGGLIAKYINPSIINDVLSRFGVWIPEIAISLILFGLSFVVIFLLFRFLVRLFVQRLFSAELDEEKRKLISEAVTKWSQGEDFILRGDGTGLVNQIAVDWTNSMIRRGSKLICLEGRKPNKELT